MKGGIQKQPTEKMSNRVFKMMDFTFKIIDFIFPHIKRRIKKFKLKEGLSIVDYGCGPGRYTVPIAREVGIKGKVYAVDIHEIALEKVKEKIKKYNLNNVEPILAKGNDDGHYDCALPDAIADIVCAIDMFFIIKKPRGFLTEIKRILKKDGVLIIDDGHQSRKKTKKKIEDSHLFKIAEETRDHLKCTILQ